MRSIDNRGKKWYTKRQRCCMEITLGEYEVLEDMLIDGLKIVHWSARSRLSKAF